MNQVVTGRAVATVVTGGDENLARVPNPEGAQPTQLASVVARQYKSTPVFIGFKASIGIRRKDKVQAPA
jgi:hypothetical protein